MINNVERGAASPTAALLGRLSGAFGLTLSTLLARAEAACQVRLVRAADQPKWQDPATGYTRRQVAPGPGSDLPLEVIEVVLPPGADIAYPAAAYAFIRQTVWVLKGSLTVREGNELHELNEGDSLEFGPPVERAFRNSTPETCRYAVVVLKC
jgi:quercetin dioxygenase-like cupin family protein